MIGKECHLRPQPNPGVISDAPSREGTYSYTDRKERGYGRYAFRRIPRHSVLPGRCEVSSSVEFLMTGDPEHLGVYLYVEVVKKMV